jgi:cytochrome c-type biogenesis protein CcmH
MKFRILLTLCLVLCLAHNTGIAKEAATLAKDPVLEAKVMKLADELRCLVCQNQTIADSNAELAIDLKNQVRAQLSQGRSEQEVIDYMVQRYGDFVLYRPPVKATTWLLWLGPFLLLIGGALTLFFTLKKRQAATAKANQRELSTQEREQMQRTLHPEQHNTQNKPATS